MKRPEKQIKRKASKPTTRLLSFQKHRPKWPPDHLTLPSTVEAIEAGRPEPPPRDQSRSAVVKRLTGIAGVQTADKVAPYPAGS